MILMYDPPGYQTESRFLDRRRPGDDQGWLVGLVDFLGLVVNERMDGLVRERG